MICYTYVFVRTNMLPVQIAVQACHACHEVGMGMKGNDVITPHLLLFGVKEEKDLRKLMYKLERKKVDFIQFYEPDMGNSLTAFATFPIRQDSTKRMIFKNYKLLPPLIHKNKEI